MSLYTVALQFLFHLQHDNTPVHKAWSIKTWFFKVGTGELECRAQSPDLNPLGAFAINWNANCNPQLTLVPDLTYILVTE